MKETEEQIIAEIADKILKYLSSEHADGSIKDLFYEELNIDEIDYDDIEKEALLFAATYVLERDNTETSYTSETQSFLNRVRSEIFPDSEYKDRDILRGAFTASFVTLKF